MLADDFGQGPGIGPSNPGIRLAFKNSSSGHLVAPVASPAGCFCHDHTLTGGGNGFVIIPIDTVVANKGR